jgi:hypothetical protein
MSNKRSGRAPALFDDALFAEDLKRTSDTGREVASAARREYERAACLSTTFSPAKKKDPKAPC